MTYIFHIGPTLVCMHKISCKFTKTVEAVLKLHCPQRVNTQVAVLSLLCGITVLALSTLLLLLLLLLLLFKFKVDRATGSRGGVAGTTSGCRARM